MSVGKELSNSCYLSNWRIDTTGLTECCSVLSTRDDSCAARQKSVFFLLNAEVIVVLGAA